ncbi:MAG: E3 binding domain-containing protein, partial [Thermoflexales bacterium]|nr:E3 binding domain-containing protein [Thermoflexales bacterium]
RANWRGGSTRPGRPGGTQTMKDVIMPKLGFTMEEGSIVRWLKQAGDAVTQGEPIVEITTDKTNMEIEAPATGILADLRAAEGDTVLVTQVIAVILGPGEKAPVSSPAPVAPHTEIHATPIAQAVARDLGVDLANIAGSGPRSKITRQDVEAAAAGKPRATPAARKAARALGVDLTDVAGSGPRGRVQAGDVSVAAVAAAANVAAAPLPVPVVDAAPAPMAIKTLPFSGMRKTIALRL